MKLYVLAHSEKAYHLNLAGYVDFDRISPNGIYPKSVRAFMKKKEARAYLKENKIEHLKIITLETT